MELNIDSIKSKPYRIVPADLGIKLSEKSIENIRNHLHKYKKIELSKMKHATLTNEVLAYKVNDRLEVYVFVNGIIIFVIRDTEHTYKDSEKKGFSYFYCKDRKKVHKNILDWKHDQSDKIKEIITDLKNLLEETISKVKFRNSSTAGWEYNGLSYVMTISFFDISTSDKQFQLNNYPEWLKKNVNFLLDPSLISMEDSMNIEDRKFQDSLIVYDDNIDYSNLEDCEGRNYFSTFISWAAVAVLGKITEYDIDEYLTLEIDLQNKWFYIYCLSSSLPKSHDELLKKNFSLVELRNIDYEIELCEKSLSDIEDTSIPDRITKIQDKIIETSGIKKLIEASKSKIQFYKEVLQFNSELKQKKFNQTSELLLYSIAFVQTISILFGWISGIIGNNNISIALIVILFFVGCYVLIRKNKE